MDVWTGLTNGWISWLIDTSPIHLHLNLNRNLAQFFFILLWNEKWRHGPALTSYDHTSVKIFCPSLPPHLPIVCSLENWSFKSRLRNFPGGPVIENLPSNAGGLGFDPWSEKQGSMCCRAVKPAGCNHGACVQLDRSPSTAAKDPACCN